NAKKRDRFRRGLNTKLKERLNLVQPDTYNELVNMAITQEDCIAAHRAEKKRKAPMGPSSAQPPWYRLVQNTPPRAPQRNAPTGRFVFRLPQQQGGFRHPVFQQLQQFGPRPNVPQFNRGNGKNRCFNCGSTSHFAKNCPQPKKSYPGQNSNQNNKGKGKKQMVQVRQGRVNFTTLAELPKGAPVMSGIFSIHNKPAVILFDSGATHSL